MSLPQIVNAALSDIWYALAASTTIPWQTYIITLFWDAWMQCIQPASPSPSPSQPASKPLSVTQAQQPRQTKQTKRAIGSDQKTIRDSCQPSLVPAGSQQAAQTKRYSGGDDNIKTTSMSHGFQNSWPTHPNLKKVCLLTLLWLLEQCSGHSSPTFCMCGQLTQGKHQGRLAGWSSEIGRVRLGRLGLAGCLSELLAWLAAWLGWLLVCLGWLGLAGPGWAWLCGRLDSWLAVAALLSSAKQTQLGQLQNICWAIVAHFHGRLTTLIYPNNVLWLLLRAPATSKWQ